MEDLKNIAKMTAIQDSLIKDLQEIFKFAKSEGTNGLVFVPAFLHCRDFLHSYMLEITKLKKGETSGLTLAKTAVRAMAMCLERLERDIKENS
jgi:hypothetical protein